jgi:cytidine deaminase
MSPRVKEHKGSIPPRELLESVAPGALWDAAIKQATRSPHQRFRTGAVLFDPDDYLIVGRGCSHDGTAPVETLSIHAERHALMRMGPIHAEGMDCMIVTLTRNNNFTQVSKPCASCASFMTAYGVRHCVFAERANDGSWSVLRTPVGLLRNLKVPRLA